MSYNIIEGVTVRFSTSSATAPSGVIQIGSGQPFTSITGTIVDPDVVTFAYSVQGQTTVTYTYTNGNTPPDPSLTIVKTAVGTYQADISTTALPGTWAYKWEGQPGVSGLDTTKTSAIFNGEVTVSPSNP